MTSRFLKTVLFLLSAVTLVSCDKDFNEIGSDLVGDDHYGIEPIDTFFIASQSYPTGAVESKNLPVAPLGVYYDPQFGKVTANFVTQVQLASVNPTLDNLIDIDKVRLYIPYFAHQTDVVDEERIYELDSIFGKWDTELNLKIRESNYFLRSQEVVDNEPQDQAYFNDDTDIPNQASAQVLNNAPDPSQNARFKFSNKEIITHRLETDATDMDSTEVKQAPGMFLTLSKAFFKSKILQAPEGMLTNNNVFANYFRGLYFEVSDPSDMTKGVLNTLDFSKGVITIYYRRNITTTTGGVSSTIPRRFEIKLNLTGNNVSLLKYENVPTQPIGDKLVVKGGAGFVTTVDIITAAERAQLVADNTGSKAMINEANLIFHVDEEASNGAIRPRRLYLYDMTHGQPTVDYIIDGSTTGNTKTSKNVFGGNLDSIRQDGTWKYWYKFRVTNYIRGLINEPDSTRVRFGLVATENILETAMARTKNPITVTNEDGSTTTYNKIPKGSVMNPFGVVLHGPNSTPAERLKLLLYITRPEEDPGN